MELEIKTLTPIWTGGIETGKMDRIHETSIIGSLRWWFEVLVRGLGGQVNDYEETCSINSCEVARIFGANGWQRRFRLNIKDSTKQDDKSPSKVESKHKYTKKNDRDFTPTWYFPKEPKDKPRVGSFIISIQKFFPDFDPQIIAGLVQFIADWAAIGARPQMGFGVIEPKKERFNTDPLYKYLTSISGDKSYLDLPSLKNIFLARIEIPDATDVTTFDLKYELRQLFRENENIKHFIMGTIKKNQAVKSKVKISRPYNNGMIRIWGWIPENPKKNDIYNNEWNREKILESIYKDLSSKYTLKVWREFNSARDSEKSSDEKVFLQSLLSDQGEIK